MIQGILDDMNTARGNAPVAIKASGQYACRHLYWTVSTNHHVWIEGIAVTARSGVPVASVGRPAYVTQYVDVMNVKMLEHRTKRCKRYHLILDSFHYLPCMGPCGYVSPPHGAIDKETEFLEES